MTDQATADLAKKCGDDVGHAVHRSMALMPERNEKFAIALAGAVAACAVLTGTIQALENVSEDDAAVAALAVVGDYFTAEKRAATRAREAAHYDA